MAKRTILGFCAYTFVDKDPAAYSLRAALEKKLGRPLTKKDATIIRWDGGPTTTTTINLFFGDTKRPNNATLEGIARTKGLKRGGWEEDDGVLPSEKKLAKWRVDHDIPEPRAVRAERTAAADKLLKPTKKRRRGGKKHWK